MQIEPLDNIQKEINIPPDKSISHRVAIISSLCKGETLIEPFLISQDTLATLECLQKCGVKLSLKGNKLTVEGEGFFLPQDRRVYLQARDSGTTMRILSGILCGQKFSSLFNAYYSLRKRPMRRITHPLRLMGANIKGRKINNDEYPPLKINPTNKLHPIRYKMPLASAQVKSALLLASLYSKGKAEIIEPAICRDHTERTLLLFKAKLIKRGRFNILYSPSKLKSPRKIFIPSDFSSASFFIVLGLILRNSEILVKNVNINPTRAYLLKVLKRMGARIKVRGKKNYYEPYADILVKSSTLKATSIEKKEIPLIIDEIPILCVAASFAKGTTIIEGVKELRVKESNRLKGIEYNLKKVGVKIRIINKGDFKIVIEGGENIRKAKFLSFSDHRIAMSSIILGLASDNISSIDNTKCIDKSFPEFISIIQSLSK